MGKSIRVATPADAEQVRAIYAPIVSGTAISFETEVPSTERIAERIEGTLRSLPWFVHEQDGQIVGYAYATQLRERAAYRWSAEVSVYVRPHARSGGVGRGLGQAVLEELADLGYVNAFGVVALPNPGSVRLMESLGFFQVGVLRKAGYKLGAWHDVGWWQRTLNSHSPDPVEPRPFSPR